MSYLGSPGSISGVEFPSGVACSFPGAWRVDDSMLLGLIAAGRHGGRIAPIRPLVGWYSDERGEMGLECRVDVWGVLGPRLQICYIWRNDFGARNIISVPPMGIASGVDGLEWGGRAFRSSQTPLSETVGRSGCANRPLGAKIAACRISLSFAFCFSRSLSSPKRFGLPPLFALYTLTIRLFS